MGASDADAAVAGTRAAAATTAGTATAGTCKTLKGHGHMTTTTHTQASERTLAVAVSEVRFGIQYGLLNERYWQHLDTALNLLQIGAGALALAGALAQGALATSIAGVMIAVVSALQLSLQPTRRSVAFRDARARFHDLHARAWGLTLRELDAELEALRRDAPVGMRALLLPAQNIVHQQIGAQDVVLPLTWGQRLALALA